MLKIIGFYSFCFLLNVSSCIFNKGAFNKQKRIEKEVRPSSSIIREDIVRTIIDLNAEKRIGIGFEKHAAIYFLYHNDKNFKKWLMILRKSKEQHLRVKFNYEDEGQRLIYVDFVK